MQRSAAVDERLERDIGEALKYVFLHTCDQAGCRKPASCAAGEIFYDVCSTLDDAKTHMEAVIMCSDDVGYNVMDLYEKLMNGYHRLELLDSRMLKKDRSEPMDGEDFYDD
jgi:hypothetical protein